jgi:hypothetical protein
MDNSTKSQSLVEFALILPLLILMVLGIVEVTIFVGSYINLIDLTREAARYASVRDPSDPSQQGDFNCSTQLSNNFYYDTACIFSPLAASSDCTDANFCNGFNSRLPFKSGKDDILITGFTVTNNIVSSHWPAAGQSWVWSDHDGDTAHNSNWQAACDGTNPTQTTTLYFTDTRINNYLTNVNTLRGFVTVEAYYCYYQVLNAPLISQFMPNPIKLHAYSIMPLPAVQASPTPRPSPTP